MELPTSVYRYLTDPTIQMGVESVLDHSPKKMPAGLGWEEFSAYSRASLAALTVQAEWAATLAALWSAIWAEDVPGWQPLTLDEQNAAGLGAEISIARCWDEEWFGRCFQRVASVAPAPSRRSRDVPTLCLSIGLSKMGLAIGVSVDGDREFHVDGFLYDQDEETWWTAATGITQANVGITAERAAAQRALNWLARQE